jgi:hypothetical protein
VYTRFRTTLFPPLAPSISPAMFLIVDPALQ